MKNDIILTKFKEWANNNNNIKAAILTSSRVSKNAEIDFLSDYDIELYVREIEPFQQSDDWLDYFGEIMVRWPYKPKPTINNNWLTRLILFKSGLRIDFQITNLPKAEMKRYINGYEVIIDKENVTNDLNTPTYDEFVIRKPSKEEFDTLVHEFWWNVYYVPKYLWRDQLPFAKFMLDNILRYEYLHKVVNWYIGSKNNWNVVTGALGKYYKKLLSINDWQEFELTYTGCGIEENWEGLQRITKLFRRLAKELSIQLGYDYPENTDKQVMEFCDKIMERNK